MDDWLDDEGFVGDHAAFQDVPDQNKDVSQHGEPEEIDDGKCHDLVPFNSGCLYLYTSHMPEATMP